MSARIPSRKQYEKLSKLGSPPAFRRTVRERTGQGTMSATVLKQTERAFERAVVEYAELQGWLVYHTYDSRRSNPGFPDLVMVRGLRLLFAELKSEKGRESKAQMVWLDALSRVTSEVWLWRPSDWLEIEEVLRRSPEFFVPFRRRGKRDR